MGEWLEYKSDLWERKDFKTKQELEKITKCKINNFDYIKLKSFTQTKPMQPKLEGNQQIGENLYNKKLWQRSNYSNI